MEHIFNCHGEWLWALQALVALPIAGVWLKSWLGRRKASHTHQSGDDG